MLIIRSETPMHSYAGTKTSNRNQPYARNFPRKVSWHPHSLPPLLTLKSRDYSRATKTHRLGTSLLFFRRQDKLNRHARNARAREEDRVTFFVYAGARARARSPNEKLPEVRFPCSNGILWKNVVDEIYFYFANALSSFLFVFVGRKEKEGKLIKSIESMFKTIRTKPENTNQF